MTSVVEVVWGCFRREIRTSTDNIDTYLYTPGVELLETKHDFNDAVEWMVQNPDLFFVMPIYQLKK